jgi:hypothetical protein
MFTGRPRHPCFEVGRRKCPPCLPTIRPHRLSRRCRVRGQCPRTAHRGGRRRHQALLLHWDGQTITRGALWLSLQLLLRSPPPTSCPRPQRASHVRLRPTCTAKLCTRWTAGGCCFLLCTMSDGDTSRSRLDSIRWCMVDPFCAQEPALSADTVQTLTKSLGQGQVEPQGGDAESLFLADEGTVGNRAVDSERRYRGQCGSTQNRSILRPGGWRDRESCREGKLDACR